jgi:hypothetical protein
MARNRPSSREQEDGAQGNLAAELAREFCERAIPDLGLLQWLRSQGVDVAHVLNVAGPIAEHSVTIHRNSFEFAQDGASGAVRAVVHIAKGDDAETPVDLIAWTKELPQTMFRCLGVAAALGIDQIENPATWFTGKPLAVHRHALNWLRAKCEGIVIFSAFQVLAKLERLPARPAGYAIAAESLAHGRALRRAWSPLPKGLRILVPEQRGESIP